MSDNTELENPTIETEIYDNYEFEDVFDEEDNVKKVDEGNIHKVSKNDDQISGDNVSPKGKQDENRVTNKISKIDSVDSKKLKEEESCQDIKVKEETNIVVEYDFPTLPTEQSKKDVRKGVKRECSRCDFKASNSKQLKMHVDNVHLGIKYNCDICECDFKSPWNLKMHVQTQHLKLKHNCPFCDHQTTDKGCLKEHIIAKHTNDEEKQQYMKKCELCDYTTLYPRSLRNHVKAIHEGGFKCELCQKILSSQSRLTEHKKLHSGEKPYNCDKCPNSYSSIDSLKQHLKKHEETWTGYAKPHQCPLCGKCFDSVPRLRDHEYTHKGEKPHLCVECGIEFSYRESFKRHMKQHSAEMPFKCVYCNFGFETEEELLHHLGKGDRNVYRCKVRKNMEMVGMAGSEDRSHVCQECGKGFKTKQNLAVHSVVHSGLKTFQCNKCDKSYNNYGGLYSHKKKVHEGRKFECQICKKQFREKANLKQHKCNLEKLALAKADTDFNSTNSSIDEGFPPLMTSTKSNLPSTTTTTHTSSSCLHSPQCVSRQPHPPPPAKCTILQHPWSKYHEHMYSKNGVPARYGPHEYCMQVDHNNYGCEHCVWFKWWGSLHGYPDINPDTFKHHLDRRTWPQLGLW